MEKKLLKFILKFNWLNNKKGLLLNHSIDYKHLINNLIILKENDFEGKIKDEESHRRFQYPKNISFHVDNILNKKQKKEKTKQTLDTSNKFFSLLSKLFFSTNKKENQNHFNLPPSILSSNTNIDSLQLEEINSPSEKNEMLSFENNITFQNEIKNHEESFSNKTDDKLCSNENYKKNQRKWIKSGIDGFDALLENGIPAESNIIVAGGPGCGKTIFCLQTLYNTAANGDDCVFLSMEERPDRLKNHMIEFGFNIEEIQRSEEQIILKANDKGRIILKRLQPVRLARSIEALLEKAIGSLPIEIDLVLDFIPNNFNATLLTLDSISAIETAFSGTKRQYRLYIEQLFRYFEDQKLTTLLITESSEAPRKFSNSGVEEFLADGIIVFYNFQGVKKRTRGAEIYKLRGAKHSQNMIPVDITHEGIIFNPEECCRN